ncbi:DUF4395 family protein [Orrella marina]|uniref:DUF4395 domain-containing protein n=1 Tax=Orrella marina TaxID=2163011 RepID=A0A2R4XIT9_9BURK|nr:DUF4395 family protein [Orrella marina]AWB33721.1 DUF4395 domain-containing protein [Orrella marina]
MLRFDVPPVNSNVVRLEAFITFAFCSVALLGFPYLLPVLAVMGLVRGFIGHYKCPSHRVFATLMERNKIAGKKENAGAKVFANKILFIAATVASILYFSGNDLWVIPTTALVIFSTLEWAFSFCAACWVYGAWYKFFPPRMPG